MTEPLTTTDVIRRLVTQVGCLLLTLDEAAHYLPWLGVVFEQPHTVRSVARECWTAWAALDDATADDDPSVPFTVGDCTSATLARSGAPRDAARVAAWLRRFVGTDPVQDHASAWAAVAYRFTPEYEAALRQLGLRPESAVVVRDGLARLSDWSDAINDIRAQLHAPVTSDWDRARYDEYQHETSTVEPTDFVPGWLVTEAFLAAMAPIARSLDQRELGLLEAWAMAVAAAHTTLSTDNLSIRPVLDLLEAYPPLSADTTPALWAIAASRRSGGGAA